MIPDMDHDGDIDGRDYYDDLGGAYHFAPKELKDDLSAPPSPGMITAARVLSALFWIAVLFLLLWVF
ncbi:MAG TPA: hypothetical protein PKH33_14075 [bacterium]|jgi:hypothetical protein|nr:MAG: hypothetical protein BWY28_02414 [bacterium ADurb.Bin236]HOC93478.1 hypothetical protein [bacterium]HOY64728.1 hypothetical protein [bacterium]